MGESHEYEKEQGMVYGGVWRAEREKENDMLISKTKRDNLKTK